MSDWRLSEVTERSAKAMNDCFDFVLKAMAEEQKKLNKAERDANKEYKEFMREYRSTLKTKQEPSMSVLRGCTHYSVKASRAKLMASHFRQATNTVFLFAEGQRKLSK